jgi:hypothetical protein
MAGVRNQPDPFRNHADAELVVFDFLRNPDDHRRGAPDRFYSLYPLASRLVSLLATAVDAGTTPRYGWTLEETMV